MVKYCRVGADNDKTFQIPMSIDQIGAIVAATYLRRSYPQRIAWKKSKQNKMMPSRFGRGWEGTLKHPGRGRVWTDRGKVSSTNRHPGDRWFFGYLIFYKKFFSIINLSMSMPSFEKIRIISKSPKSQ